MRIRPAEIGDLRGVSDVHATTWRAAYPRIVPDGYLAEMSAERSLARRHERYPDYPVLPDGEELVAQEDSRIVGYVSLGRVRDDGMPADIGEIWALYVLPDHQGSGLGTALLTAGVARLHATGFAEVVLWVLTGNITARAYYERRGFVFDGAVKYWTREDWELPQLRYRYRPSVNRTVS